jgi:hypothetical protein
MRRVYAFWVLRTAYHSLLLKGVAISLLFIELRELVSLRNVITNTLQSGGIDRMVSYLEYSFAHTQASVQVTLALVGVLAVWFVVDAIRKDFVVPVQQFALR